MTPTPATLTRQAGPPPGPLAAISAALLVAGLIVSAARGGTIPAPDDTAASIVAYFRGQSDAVRAAAVLTFASAVPLAIYAATIGARLRTLGADVPGASIASAGGILAAAALAGSSLALWVAARPEIRAQDALIRALHDLAFVAGGPAHVVFLGLLVAGIAVPVLLLGLLPRPVAITGLVIALVGEVAFLALAWSSLTPLVPIARFTGLAWLIWAGFQLPNRSTP
jgi:hypothetical protein